MEKLTDLDEAMNLGDNKKCNAGVQEECHQVALFFMDPDDALAVYGEMSQMEQIEQADICIASASLSKALRQSSNLGKDC